MDVTVGAARTEDEFRVLVASSLKELSVAVGHLSEQNAKFDVRQEEIMRRLDGLERRDEKLTDHALEQALVARPVTPSGEDNSPRSVGALLNRLYTDWRIVCTVAGLIGVLVGSHLGITWHW